MSANSRNPAGRAAIEERILRDWGLELPESIFRFWSFLESLGPVEERALEDMGVSPFGITDLFADPGRLPVEGIDVRVHGRYYRDPPEFLTFMHGGSDGLHFGLWFDDGRTCSTVASYYNNDGGEIDTTASTPLEAVRAVLERVWRDLEDNIQEEGAPARRAQLALLRDALTAVETGDRPELGLAYSTRYDRAAGPVDPDRITTLDGAGALASGASTLDRPGHRGADEYKFATYMYTCSTTPPPCGRTWRTPASAARRATPQKPCSWGATCTGRQGATLPARPSRTNSSCSPTGHWTAPRWRASPRHTTATVPCRR